MFVLEFWHWWALALIFVVVEALILSGVFAAFAIAGLFTGMASYYYPELEWRPQLLIFASISAASFFAIRFFFADWLNKNADAYNSTSEMIGKNLVLKLPIQNGFGEIEIEGKNWAIKGPELKAGTEVKVIGIDSYFLKVYPLSAIENASDVDDSLK